MPHHAFQRSIGLLSLMLAFLSSPASAKAGYAPLPSTNSLVGEVFDFVGDFNQWNASFDNRPLLLLELTPTQERGDMALLLFWLWLQSPKGGTIDAALPSFLQQDLKILDGFLLSSPPWKGTIDPLSGSLPAGQTGNNLSLLAGQTGNNLPVSNSSLAASLLSSSDSKNGQGYGGNRFSRTAQPDLKPHPLDPISAPEPASLTLLGTGALGFLIFWKWRRRTA